MLLKIKVVTAEGGKISYGRATGRYFAQNLERNNIGIGYLMAIWDEEKRALHDRLCKTTRDHGRRHLIVMAWYYV